MSSTTTPDMAVYQETVEGRRLRIGVTGDGPPLLLINGLGANLEMWTPFVAALGDGLRVIAFDAPGTGGSPPACLPTRMPGLARLAGGVLDLLGHAQADVLGYSLGGAIAQQLAYQEPHRVRRLVLAASSFGLGSDPGSWLAWSLLFTPLRYYSRSLLAFTARTAMGGRSARDPDALAGHADARLKRPPTLWGYQSQLFAATGWSSRRWLGTLPQPTLVLAGAEDPINPVSNARRMVEMLADGQLVVVERAGHMLLLDQSLETGPIVRDFLLSDVTSPLTG